MNNKTIGVYTEAKAKERGITPSFFCRELIREKMAAEQAGGIMASGFCKEAS